MTGLLSHFAKYAKIYVALSRYRRLLLQDAQNLGHPVTRHLWLHYPDDENVINMDLQFLLGRDILVAPVLEPNINEHTVYLPRGSWTHLWSGKSFILRVKRLKSLRLSVKSQYLFAVKLWYYRT